jgi:hypothetical protein
MMTETLSLVSDSFDSLPLENGRVALNQLLHFLGQMSRTTATRTLTSFAKPNSVIQIGRHWYIEVEEARAVVEVYRNRAQKGSNTTAGKAKMWSRDMAKRALAEKWISEIPKRSNLKETTSKDTIIHRINSLEETIKLLTNEIKQIKEVIGI